MTSYREEVLGIPEQVQATVDVLLFAETRGPATLDDALERLGAGELRNALRALLGRHNHTHHPRTAARDAWADFDRGEERAERINDRSWAR